MVALGFGKFARADRIYALERITAPPAQRVPSGRMADDSEAEAQTNLNLNGTARTLCVLLGLLGLGLGVLAVFKSENQAGTVAVLVVGGLLLILGMGGRIPDRGAVGNATYEFRSSSLGRLLKNEDPDVQEAVANEVLAVRPRGDGRDVPAPLVREAANVIRKSDAMRMVANIAMEAFDSVSVKAGAVPPDVRLDRPSLYRADLLIYGPGLVIPVFFVSGAGPKVRSRAILAAKAFGAQAAVVVAYGNRNPDEPLREDPPPGTDGVRLHIVRLDAPDQIIGEVLADAMGIAHP